MQRIYNSQKQALNPVCSKYKVPLYLFNHKMLIQNVVHVQQSGQKHGLPTKRQS